MLTSAEIRQQFIDFFVQKYQHTAVPSSPVVPPPSETTLMFANAGMNQFKDVFLATGTRPYSRAVDTQKCIRAGGKHNDLDDVGRDTYHHTFFEMLGNWSFGDYFKKEAIAWAWELLTAVWKLDASRLHVTVFEGDPDNGLERDEESIGFWKAVGVDPKNIHLGSKKDNFWEMGETGPCGPCTEIHIDRTPDKTGGPLVNMGSADAIEIWNIVFIQYNRNADKSLTPLPAKHVDTGMGFERIAAVLQNVASNYDTDIFVPIFQAIREVTNAPEYTGSLESITDIAYRVIADHIRTLTFALTDGGIPANDGRGYVLRSILRRAERFGRQYFKTTEPFMHRLVPVVVEHFGAAFPELRTNPKRVADTVLDEEKTFLRNYDRGIGLYRQVADAVRKDGGTIIPAEKAFDLHQTFGFFVDITDQMGREEGLTVDRVGFEAKMKAHAEISRQGQKKIVISAVQGDLPTTDDSVKYRATILSAKVVGWVKANTVFRTGELPNDPDAVLLDRTCFYGEQGGQVGDTGTLSSASVLFEVTDTQRLGEAVLHVGTFRQGMLSVGDEITATVSGDSRGRIVRNHTATHLLNLALRDVLGEHVEQRGSLVDADRTRYDFTHSAPLTSEELRRVESHVNERILADLPVAAREMPLIEAKKLPGVRAVFGEKYPDPVRVVTIGAKTPADVTAEMSVEFCGGVHLTSTASAGYFRIVSQEPVSKGIRRLSAVTGPVAFARIGDIFQLADGLATELACRPEDLPTRLPALLAEVQKLRDDVKRNLADSISAVGDTLFDAATVVNGTRIIAGEFPLAPVEQMRTQADRLRQKAGSAIVVIFNKDEGKVPILVALTNDLVERGLSAGEIIKPIAQAVGGSGGGKRADMAQAGGKDPSKIADAVAKAIEVGRAALGG